MSSSQPTNNPIGNRRSPACPSPGASLNGPFRDTGAASSTLRAATDPGSLAGVTIRWFTDAARQDMRDAAEARRVLDELERAYRPLHTMTAQERDVAVTYLREHGETVEALRIDPYRRS